jgi:DNA polymerase-3 subunit epsilon
MKIAVIDVETTGLFPSKDRVVEIAVVLVALDGNRLGQFSSLVNPERDVGPTSIHGLTAKDVYSAPRFGELAGHLISVLEGVVAIAGHNVLFDESFLKAEFERLGHRWPEAPTVCTMRLAGGGRLVQCCEDFQVPIPANAHSALDDAHATAELLARLLGDAPDLKAGLSSLPPVRWPDVPKTEARLVTRDSARQFPEETSTYLNKLLNLMASPTEPDDAAGMAYLDLLSRVIEDRRIEETEGSLLHGLATNLGLTGRHVRELHRAFFEQLAGVALHDKVLTAVEQQDLNRVAQLLGLTNAEVDETIRVVAHDSSRVVANANLQSAPETWVGKRVCFTGESQCTYCSQPLSRASASALAAQRGLIVVDSVTKKLDILVVADPYTQSGKAAKARRYGIRVFHEPVFWGALGVEVQ